MAKKKLEASEEVSEVGSVDFVSSVGSEETLNVDHHFSDEQHARIAEAGFEPATVRQELGLALVNKEPKITLTEAIARAKAKYGK